MLSSELRTKYLKFFEGKGHLIHASDSLVPNDPTLLYTSAGMVQFKPYYVGERVPPNTRITTCQKCLRTDDIDEVGDAVHHTFFEMLGNFSFGDYFKRESILWAWEFLTEVLKFNPEHLWTSVYIDDDEAADVWLKEIGFPAERLVRLGEDKNYWPANAPSKGPNGVCGPCNEIFVDVTPELGPPKNPTWSIAHEGNRFVEVWNLVFTQFDRQEDGTLKPLPTKNIDTGMGLERTVAILQGTKTNYETDIFLPIVQQIESLSGVKYGSDEETDRCIRVIADHIRSAVFVIADGVMPSNVGRGYVLRRLIRNSVVKGRKLGLEKPFLTSIIPTVVGLMGSVYHELADRQSYVEKLIGGEEERFRGTLDRGIDLLEQAMSYALSRPPMAAQHPLIIDGETAFVLYDTYGFPLELTCEIVRERGLEIDTEGFRAAMEKQRARGRKARDFGSVMAVGGDSPIRSLEDRVREETNFVGYDQTTQGDCEVIEIIRSGQIADEASEGDEVELVLDKTPFYAESGGQVGDTGEIKSDGAIMEVLDTEKVSRFVFHKAIVKSGSILVGDRVKAVVDVKRRLAIARNHTATHLLHSALHNVLGEHALQKGSVVDPERLRFDFSHFQAVTDEELRAIENDVNELILADLETGTTVTCIDEARKMGATALFGEKYGDSVRVVKMGDKSIELCGGTHLCRSSQVGFFKLTSESSVGAGLRRLEAVTGEAAIRFVQEMEDTVRATADALGASVTEVVAAAQRAVQAARDAQREVDKLKSKSAADSAGDLADSVKEAGAIKYVTATVPTVDVPTLQKLVDGVADKLKSGVVVLAGVDDGKVLFVGKVTSDLVAKGFHAGNILRDVAKIAGGGGGGRPEFAQAGGKDASKVPDALKKAEEIIAAQAEG